MTKGVLILNNRNSILKTFIPPLPNPHFEPLIELISNREATVEGAYGIVEYNDCIATINCRTYLLTFEGFNICIQTLSKDCISVKGKFNNISFSQL